MPGCCALRFCLAAPRLGHERKHENETSRASRTETQECDSLAEPVGDIPSKSGSQRCANANGDADHALREIEMPAAARRVSDHKRHEHTEGRCRKSIEQLHRD